MRICDERFAAAMYANDSWVRRGIHVRTDGTTRTDSARVHLERNERNEHKCNWDFRIPSVCVPKRTSRVTHAAFRCAHRVSMQAQSERDFARATCASSGNIKARRQCSGVEPMFGSLPRENHELKRGQLSRALCYAKW